MQKQEPHSRIECSWAFWFSLSAARAFVGTTGALAQSSSFVTQLVVVVDGSTNPELIPEALAYQHFFLAVASHEQPSAQETLRQDAQLAPLWRLI